MQVGHIAVKSYMKKDKNKYMIMLTKDRWKREKRQLSHIAGKKLVEEKNDKYVIVPTKGR